MPALLPAALLCAYFAGMSYEPTLYEKRVFFAYTVLFVAVVPVWLLVPKGQEVKWLNGLHSEAADLFFRNVTHFGDGLAMALFILLLALFVRYSYAFIALLALAASGGGAQIIKRMLADVPRPVRFFDPATLEQLHFVEGVKVHEWMSFPSGHTATAFALALMIALVFQRRWLTLCAGALAVLTAVSRIYLLQHFLSDTLAGGLMGMVLTFAVWMVAHQRFGWLQAPGWQRALFRRA